MPGFRDLSRLVPSSIRRRIGFAPEQPPPPPVAREHRLDPGTSFTLTLAANPSTPTDPPESGSGGKRRDGGSSATGMLVIGAMLVAFALATAWLIYWLSEHEERRQLPRESREIAILGLALLLGLLVALFGRVTCRIQSDGVLIFLIIAPLFLLLVATERVNLLKAPGGLELSFVERVVQIRNDPANQAVVLEVAEAAPISPGLPPQSVSRLTMSIQFGRGDYQRQWLIENLAPGQSQYVNLRYVVFVDADNRFIAFMPLTTFITVLQLDEEGPRLERVINQGRRLELLRFPGVIQTALVATGPATDDLPTNGDVLRTMLQHNLPAIAVVGPDGRLIGLVERDQLVSDLLLDLTSEDDGN
jgi:hypothetical protein